MCGLTDKQLTTLTSILRRHKAVERACIFGSRAKGNYKPGSDIDIAVAGPALTRRDILALASDFDDTDLPYTVDTVHYDTIANDALRDHIDRVGIWLPLRM